MRSDFIPSPRNCTDTGCKKSVSLFKSTLVLKSEFEVLTTCKIIVFSTELFFQMMDERFPLDNGQDMTNHQENCTRTPSEVSFFLACCSRWFTSVHFISSVRSQVVKIKGSNKLQGNTASSEIYSVHK